MVKRPLIGIFALILALLGNPALAQTAQRQTLKPLDAAVVSVTQIHGGDTWNVIPATVVLRGTTRCFRRSWTARCSWPTTCCPVSRWRCSGCVPMPGAWCECRRWGGRLCCLLAPRWSCG